MGQLLKLGRSGRSGAFILPELRLLCIRNERIGLYVQVRVSIPVIGPIFTSATISLAEATSEVGR